MPCILLLLDYQFPVNYREPHHLVHRPAAAVFPNALHCKNKNSITMIWGTGLISPTHLCLPLFPDLLHLCFAYCKWSNWKCRRPGDEASTASVACKEGQMAVGLVVQSTSVAMVAMVAKVGFKLSRFFFQSSSPPRYQRKRLINVWRGRTFIRSLISPQPHAWKWYKLTQTVHAPLKLLCTPAL